MHQIDLPAEYPSNGCLNRMNPNDDVPSGASTSRSMSEVRRASPRATEPKTASLAYPDC